MKLRNMHPDPDTASTSLLPDWVDVIRMLSVDLTWLPATMPSALIRPAKGFAMNIFIFGFQTSPAKGFAISILILGSQTSARI